MNLEYVGFAAGCFLCYAIGRSAGYSDGYYEGLSSMKKAILKDMKEYPTKWRWHIDREEKRDKNRTD